MLCINNTLINILFKAGLCCLICYEVHKVLHTKTFILLMVMSFIAIHHLRSISKLLVVHYYYQAARTSHIILFFALLIMCHLQFLKSYILQKYKK